MVRAVAKIAGTAGAKCYTDPFEASSPGTTADVWSRPWFYDRPTPWLYEKRSEFHVAALNAQT